jgi:hypothetical protein
MFTENRKLRPEIASRLTEPIMKSIRQVLTDPSLSDKDIHNWVDDVFKSLEDENGVLHLNTEIFSTDRIYVDIVDTSTLYVPPTTTYKIRT